MNYDYTCGCGQQFEANRKVAERETAPCPGCGSFAARVFTPSLRTCIHPEFWHAVTSDFNPDPGMPGYYTRSVWAGARLK